MTSAHWTDAALDRALDSVEARLDLDVYPHVTEGGVWGTSPDGFWTGGFWIGLLWAGYEERGDERFRATAERLLERFILRSDEARNHDLGMMFQPSAVKGWEIVGDVRYRDASVQAAYTLASQLNPAGGFIPGWGFFGNDDWSGISLVDTLMNLPLLVWAAGQTGDDELLRVALTHGRTSLGHHLRADGSTYHAYRFDPHSGAPIAGDTYQGLAAESCWARGQGWAITGCAQLARQGVGDEYRDAAEAATRWYLEHLPDDTIPYWDFDAAAPGQPRDASAAAIAAFGMLLLADLGTPLPAAQAAEETLRALVRSAQAPAGHPALLLHATADLPHGLGIDESTIYGDYFFVAALRELRRQATDDQRRSLVAQEPS
jgi:unsaturated chondroitin disaccharide hydrolase